MDKEVNWIIEFENILGDYKNTIEWLITNIEDVSEKHPNGEQAGKPKPYYFSAHGQCVRFRSQTAKWHLEIRGNSQKQSVKFSEMISLKTITEFALSHSWQTK